MKLTPGAFLARRVIVSAGKCQPEKCKQEEGGESQRPRRYCLLLQHVTINHYVAIGNDQQSPAAHKRLFISCACCHKTFKMLPFVSVSVFAATCLKGNRHNLSTSF